MQEFPAAILTRDPIALKDAASKQPVAITEYRRPRFVLMSYDAYMALTSPRHPDPRRVYRTENTPDNLRTLMLEALDQPYEC